MLDLRRLAETDCDTDNLEVVRGVLRRPYLPKTIVLAFLFEYRNMAELHTNADLANMAGRVPPSGGKLSEINAA